MRQRAGRWCARKLIVDTTGAEREQALDEWVEIGIYPGDARKREELQVILANPTYLQKYRMTQSKETITLNLLRESWHAGVDPRSLMIDVHGERPLLAGTDPLSVQPQSSKNCAIRGAASWPS